LELLTRRWLQALAAAGLLISFAVRDAFFRDTFRYSLQGLCLLPLVASVCFTPSLSACTHLLKLPALRLIGQLSYSIYLMHPLAIFLAELVCGTSTERGSGGGMERSVIFPLAALSLTGLLACCSYHLVELPLLGMRRRFRALPLGTHRMLARPT
jgi:peptidoglycan/LPS O-acetylase OafA/YrhL